MLRNNSLRRISHLISVFTLSFILWDDLVAMMGDEKCRGWGLRVKNGEEWVGE